MPLGFQSHTKPLDFENHLSGFPGMNTLPPVPLSASLAGGLCRTQTSLLCSDPLPLVLSHAHAPGSRRALWGQPALLSSGQGCACLLTNWVNDSVSPPVQTRWPRQPKHNTTDLCTRPGDHGNVRASSTLLFQEAGQSPSRRLAQHQTPCLGNWKGIVLGQMDVPKLTAPGLGPVPQSCAPLPAHRGHLLPWLQFRAFCPVTVLWHGCHQAPGSTMGMDTDMEWH